MPPSRKKPPARAPAKPPKSASVDQRTTPARTSKRSKTSGHEAPPAPRRSLERSTTKSEAPAPTPPVAGALRRSRTPVPIADRAGEMRGKYVYCIIRTTDPLRYGPVGIGIDPSDVHTVSYKDIAAVVSDTPIEVHDPTRENVLAHERVNETVMRKHTVIPMSFGTVFKTRDDIVELLRSAYDAFHDVLVKMQDKLEFGLKVLWERDVILKQIEAEDEDVRRLKNEILAQRGSTYFARMQYGRLVDAALQARSERYVADIFHELRDVSVASRANKPIGDKMIMNAAFLVSRDKESAFDSRVKRIGARYDKLTFKYTGPWPPYNFVNIRLKLERAKENE